MTDTPYNKKIQNFFSEYVNCAPVWFHVNGMMKKEIVKEAADLLLKKMFFHPLKI